MFVRFADHIAVALVALVAALCMHATASALPRPWLPLPRFEYRDAVPALAGRLDSLARPAAPGFALVVLRDGVPVLERYSGVESVESKAPIGPDTRFYVASVGKTFTAVAVLLLYEQGRLRLEDSLSRYVDALPSCTRGIRIHHLLNHTSGLPDHYDALGERVAGLDNPGVLRFVRDLDSLEFEPGLRYAYSNTAYVLLAEVIERVSGESYEAFISKRLFQPLGMTHSVVVRRETPEFPHRARGYRAERGSYVEDDYRGQYTVGSGGSYSTIPDLLRWHRAVMESRLLKPATTALMFETPATLSGRRSYLGMGWSDETPGPRTPQLEGLRSYAALGLLFGFRAIVQMFPDMGLTYIALSNAGELPVMGQELAGILLRRAP